MNSFSVAVLFACVSIVVGIVGFKEKKVLIGIGQKEVCFVKQSCVDCLQLSHCSWCKTKNQCFSNEVTPDFCKNETTEYTDFGFSLQKNAECVCAERADLIDQNCHPPEYDASVEPPCSGRGNCVCGRCVCETYENSTKMVMGEYCEYDNFSCDGPLCNEGPYSWKQPEVY